MSEKKCLNHCCPYPDCGTGDVELHSPEFVNDKVLEIPVTCNSCGRDFTEIYDVKYNTTEYED